MPALTTIDEATQGYLTCVPKDKTGTAASPSSMRYRVDCDTTGAAVRAWTALTPGTSVEITLDADDNAMQTATNANEVRVVTVECTYGSGDLLVAEYRYNVRNLRFYS